MRGHVISIHCDRSMNLEAVAQAIHHDSLEEEVESRGDGSLQNGLYDSVVRGVEVCRVEEAPFLDDR